MRNSLRRNYGYVPDAPDSRDFLYRQTGATRPQNVDLRAKMPQVWDQGQLGSCTAFALTAAIAFIHGFVGSQLFLYYKERAIEHSVHSDAGAQIRDGVKVLAKYGLPPEDLWPYNGAPAEENPVFAKRPPSKVYAAAKQELVSAYHRLSSVDDYLDCLAAGSPFVIGITVFSSFESAAVAANGIVPMPKPSEQQLGGHAICVVGYDQTGFIVRNSWGADWGQHGYFHIPTAYLAAADLAGDAWVITGCPK
jgi:C1A family cysteine protease